MADIGVSPARLLRSLITRRAQEDMPRNEPSQMFRAMQFWRGKYEAATGNTDSGMELRYMGCDSDSGDHFYVLREKI